MKKECEHKDVEFVGKIKNTSFCFKCGKNLIANDIEINNEWYEIGGFCDNEKCERFLLLVV